MLNFTLKNKLENKAKVLKIVLERKSLLLLKIIHFNKRSLERLTCKRLEKLKVDKH